MSNSAMTRSQFDAASPAERMAHVKADGRVVNDEPAAPRYAGPNEIARVQFDCLEPGAKLDLLRSGVRVVDAGPASVATMGPEGMIPAARGFGWVKADA